MPSILYPLATPSDYIKLTDGAYSLPNTEDYLMLEGAFCEDPNHGFSEYNRALIRYIKKVSNNDYGENRYSRIFYQYRNNRRIKKVLSVVEAVKNFDETKQNKFTHLESILFFHLPIEYFGRV